MDVEGEGGRGRGRGKEKFVPRVLLFDDKQIHSQTNSLSNKFTFKQKQNIWWKSIS